MHDGEHCVHKEGPDGKPTGESLGCHPTHDKAEEQMRALYAADGAKSIYESLKVGMRNNATDQAGLNAMHDMTKQLHDMTVSNGAECKCGDEMEHSEREQEGADIDGNYPMKGVQRGTNPVSGTSVSATYAQSPVNDFSLAEALAGDGADPEKTLVAFGGEIKALGYTPDGGLRLGGYLVKFGSPDQTDVSDTRDFFTKETDFGAVKTSNVYYNHRLPFETEDGREITIRSRVGEASLSIDDLGVAINAILYNRKEYERFVNSLVSKTINKQGWSSGTANHLVARVPQRNGSNWIKSWPLGADASVTFGPAEPRNAVIPLKSLNVGSLPPGRDVLVNAAPDGAEANKSLSTTQPTQPHLGGNMPTELELLLAEVKSTNANIAALGTQLQAHGQELAALKSKVNEPQLPPATTPNIPDAAKGAPITGVRDLEAEKPYDSLGEQLIAIKDAALPGRTADKRLHYIKEVAYKATGASEAGTEGFLLQRDFITDLQARMYPTGSILSQVRRIPIGADKNGIKIKMVNETSRATGSRFGGPRTYWMAEGGTITVSNSDYRLFELDLQKLGGLYVATEELLQDVTALNSLIPELFAKEMQFTIEDAIVEGNGTGKPTGLLSSQALITVNKETGQAAATVVNANILKMWNRMWAPLRSGAVWLVHQDVEPQLQQLALPVGTAALEPRFVTYAPDGSMRIFGRPVMVVEYCSTVGTVGDIILTNLNEYYYIEKGGIQASSSIHAYYSTGEEAYRWITRVNGKSPWNSALTPFKGTNTLSSIVALQTRS